MLVNKISFPDYKGIRCLMMPYIQGEPLSVPKEFRNGYEEILTHTYISRGDLGYLTIDESMTSKGKPHRGDRAKYGRALHTEAGKTPEKLLCWGHTSPLRWGGGNKVFLDRDTQILLANNLSSSCAVWEKEHEDTSLDGDIGNYADLYPLEEAIAMQAGEVHQIGVLTPHESLPTDKIYGRQFLRIVSNGVHGREDYFTKNPLM